MHHPIHIFMGASALLLVTAFPGIASRIQPRSRSQPEQQLFDPQNLQQISLYTTDGQSLSNPDSTDSALLASAAPLSKAAAQSTLE